MFARAKLHRALIHVLSSVLIVTSLPMMSDVVNAAVPSARQLMLLSPSVTTPASVAMRYYGGAVATSADGSRSVIGESGAGGVGGEVTIYDCTASGCVSAGSLNALATRTVTITDRKSTRLNSSHTDISRMPSSA